MATSPGVHPSFEQAAQEGGLLKMRLQMFSQLPRRIHDIALQHLRCCILLAKL
jgi:hypothetical protein